MKVVSKSQLAQSLEVTKARVSQYVARGMPVRSDGKIDYEAAVKWIAENVVPLNPLAADKGAKRAGRLTRKAAAKTAPVRRPTSVEAAHAHAITDAFSAALNRMEPALAEALVAAGIDLPKTFAAVPIIMQAVSGVATKTMEDSGLEPGGSWDADGICWRAKDHAEPLEPDWSALASHVGETVDIDAWQRASGRLPFWSDDWKPVQSDLGVFDE